MHQLCLRFAEDLATGLDPVGGVWKYDPTKQWVIYTDASNFAYGWVVEIGGVVVEDGTRLRKAGDRRQINQAEMDALFEGLEAARAYKQANNITGKLAVTLFSDSRSAVAWTSESRTGGPSVKSRDAQLILSKRDTFLSKAKKYDLETSVIWVDGNNNLADTLSRPPTYFVPVLKKYFPTGYCPDMEENVVLAAAVEALTREFDLLGRVVLSEQETRAYLKAVHRHEGAEALYRLVRQFVSTKSLFDLCVEVRGACEECQVGQRTPSAFGLGPPEGTEGRARGLPDVPRATSPWERCYVDIKGPLFNDSFGQRVYVTALKDGASGFVIARYSYGAPSYRDLIAVAQDVRHRYFAVPDVLHFDNGSQMLHAEFAQYLSANNVSVVRTPVGASWYNGTIESFFKVLQDRLCSSFCLRDTFSEAEFVQVLNDIVENYNCTPQEGRDVSPARLLLNYEPTCVGPPTMRHKRNQVLFAEDVLKPKHPIDAPDDLIRWEEVNGRKQFLLPKVGESWLVLADSAKKMEPRYLWCTVLRRISRARYVVLDETGRAQVKALKHLKRVNQEAFQKTAEQRQAIEDYLKEVDGDVGAQLSRRGRKSRAAKAVQKAISRKPTTRTHSVPVRD